MISKKSQTKIISIILITIISLLGSYFSNPSSKTNIKHKGSSEFNLDLNKQYEVSKVIDGDTFNIKVDNEVIKIRLLGIDTPETVDPRKTVQCFGKEASDKAKELLNKHSVTLETDPTQSKIDKFGRVLAYVYREDGLFINKYLIENGYAHEYTYNTPYSKQDEFKKLEKQARENKIGLWGDKCAI